jgi:two-component system, NtrC family, sensor histidine kinase KinB
MTLRVKLLLAQAPLAAALIVVGISSVAAVLALGQSSEAILLDNYRSVLAAQRMKESLERIDSAALFMVAGAMERAATEETTHRAAFERELLVQESNITEPGELEATRKLRQAWSQYLVALDAFMRGPSAERYFRELEPRFRGVKEAADEILALNQDAMVRKSEAARQSARAKTNLMIGVALVALALGLLGSTILTSRLLRPLANLGLVARRVGEGDLSMRATVRGRDELARVAHEFNDMAAKLETYRKSSLGDLLQAQQASQAAIDSIPDPVVVFGIDGGVLSANEAAEALLRTESIAAKQSPLALVEPGLRAAIERARDHVLAGKGPYVPKGFEEAEADGERWLLPRATPLYGEERGVIGVTVLVQDVTRLRRFDELRQNTVATVAHEFRTPLTSLRMAIHLCVEGAAGELNPKQLDLLGAAREDCERLQTIVDDLLDLARLQAGKVELERRPISAEELVNDALEAHRAEAARTGVELTSHVTPTLDPITGDAARLRLVLANLVSNSLRHTPKGGTVRVTAEPAAGEPPKIRFEVTDDGEGIPAEHLPRVFERFYRVPGTAGGAGFGLSIAREIVEAHGGEIGASSAPGQGSTFWFTLPV